MNTVITGASSGIGQALAFECAKRGDRLFLCGRDPQRLESVVKWCRGLGAKAEGTVLDVTDREATETWLRACDANEPIERVFSNAGIGTGIESEENVRRTFDVNVNGNLNVVLAALALFRARTEKPKHAQILITASIAGYGPLKSCPAYAATKSCMKTWGLSLRGMLAPEGIRVSVICPGFVRSRITDQNTCPMPFFMEAEKAARIILKRADANIGLIAFPWPMRLATWFLSILPFRVNEFINRLLPAKVSKDRVRAD